ncbi:minor capsid protein [Capybara microvirus Cap3_SP_391]|nr:minor capsid protein [Capybara microvirus Cap3_SP_391]
MDSEEDIYEKIQADLEDSKIENIIQRVEYGDVGALSARQGIYADIADMPTSWAEAQTKITAMEQIFNKLPLEVRKAYDFNFRAFIADYGSDQFMEALGVHREGKPVEQPAAEKPEGGEAE